MKIIVVGAGIGGLEAARLLAGEGAEVYVVERAQDVAAMRYDQYDDVDADVFRRCGLPVPHGSFAKRDWTFVSPRGGVREMHEANPDLSVDRKELNRMLVDGAKFAGAEMIWGAECSGAIVEEGRVVGIEVMGERAYADLVIDSAGMDSAIKASLPGNMVITRHDDDEKFSVYRAFFKRNEGAAESEFSNKAYLKHSGEQGISWVIRRGGVDDVLVGNVGNLTVGQMHERLNALRADDTGIGTVIEHGQGFFRIPVRFPATRAVADGYAAIGDAAYLTVPMLGSGIATSLRAAHMLARSLFGGVKEGGDAVKATAIQNLWRYQVSLFKAFADHCGADVMRRGVLALDDATLDFLLTSDVLTNDDVCALAKGKMPRLTLGDALGKAFRAGIKNIGKLTPVAAMLSKAKKAARIAADIPRSYDEAAIFRWEEKLNKAVRGR